MAGSRELGFLKTSSCSLKEKLVRTTLRNVRSQGHTYIELREEGKRLIFFCTLCISPCYSDSVLFDHLKGNLHTQRLAAAKTTLLKPNPWPFNDGVLFFHDSSNPSNHLILMDANEVRLLLNQKGDDVSLATVEDDENVRPIRNRQSSSDDSVLVIPGVLHKDEISNVEVRLMGVGQISARYYEKEGVAKGIKRIWCEWLGDKNCGDAYDSMIPEHDFAVVTCEYNYNLGRKALVNDVRYLLSSSHRPDMEEEENDDVNRKKRKSFSDPEDVSESFSNQYDSSGEESLSSNSSSSRMLIDGYDDHILHSRVILSKSTRRELRRQKRVASERMCDICQHKMLPGKDVAALLNRKTGKLVCSSRNVNGAFHVFHISCLVHWILLCEFEIDSKQFVSPKGKPKCRRKNGAKCKEKKKETGIRTAQKDIHSVFCPECQGTGVDVDREELEKPKIPLSEMFKYKIKASDARRAWMKTPEMLHNCSIGFQFRSQFEETMQEKVSPQKLLYFYRAGE